MDPCMIVNDPSIPDGTRTLTERAGGTARIVCPKVHLEKTGCPLSRIAPCPLMRSCCGAETSQPDADYDRRTDEPKTRMVRQAEGDR